MDSVIPALVVVRKYSFCCFCFCWISSIFKEISSGKILQHSENNRNLLIYLKVKYFKFGDWKKWKTHAILAAFARACVCVCVCVWVGGWVGVRVCLYSSTVKGSSHCKTSVTYLRGTDQQCYLWVLCHISPPKTKLQLADLLERKYDMI